MARQQSLVRALSALIVLGLSMPQLRAGAGSAGTRYVVFFDLSSSPRSCDRDAWAGFAETAVIRQLRPGDALTIYPIGPDTLGAAAIFSRVAPAVPKNHGIDALMATTVALARIRTGAVAALRQAMAARPTSTRRTDVLSSLDRYEADLRRRMVVLFLSDMLHADRDLNLERQEITTGQIAAVVRALASQRQWRTDQLAGARVYCLLSSQSVAQFSAATDRRVLKQFYQMVFQTVGARLMRFDTNIDPSSLTEDEP